MIHSPMTVNMVRGVAVISRPTGWQASIPERANESWHQTGVSDPLFGCIAAKARFKVHSLANTNSAGETTTDLDFRHHFEGSPFHKFEHSAMNVG